MAPRRMLCDSLKNSDTNRVRVYPLGTYPALTRLALMAHIQLSSHSRLRPVSAMNTASSVLIVLLP